MRFKEKYDTISLNYVAVGSRYAEFIGQNVKSVLIEKRGEQMKPYYLIEAICVCCGAPVPEGRQVCWECEKGADSNRQTRPPWLDAPAEKYKNPRPDAARHKAAPIAGPSKS